jgi:hypothetical protein
MFIKSSERRLCRPTKDETVAEIDEHTASIEVAFVNTCRPVRTNTHGYASGNASLLYFPSLFPAALNR